MDGRWLTVLLTLIVPIVLIGLTIAEFSSNIVAIFALFGVMIGGALYLLSYTETYA